MIGNDSTVSSIGFASFCISNRCANRQNAVGCVRFTSFSLCSTGGSFIHIRFHSIRASSSSFRISSSIRLTSSSISSISSNTIRSLFDYIHPCKQLSNNIGIQFLNDCLGLQASRDIHFGVKLGVPMIYLLSFTVYFFYANQEIQRTTGRGNMLRNRPIEMHDCIVDFIDSDILRDIASEFSIRSPIIDINDHSGHIVIIPISRTIKCYSLDIMIVLNSNSSQLSRNGNNSFSTNYDMRFHRRISRQCCNVIVR